MSLNITTVDEMKKQGQVKVKDTPIEKLPETAGFRAGQLSPSQSKLRKGKGPGKPGTAGFNATKIFRVGDK
jgi:hypothetical protein